MKQIINFVTLICIFLPLSSQQPRQEKISSFSSRKSPWQPLQNRILVSANGTFAAGFRKLSNSSNSYTFSIWYYNISPDTKNQFTVWSANENSRDITINSSGSLVVSSTGQLSLEVAGDNIWPWPRTGNVNSSEELILQDDGNLVFGSWQSFDYPTDTILPAQNLNKTAQLVSKNQKFRFRNFTELVFNSSDSYYTAKGGAFKNFATDGKIVLESGDLMVSADVGENSTRRLTLDNDGNLRIYSFVSTLNEWTVQWEALTEPCRIKGTCGMNSICTYDKQSKLKPYCVCPPGFRSVSPGNKDCERKTPIKNVNKGQFISLDFVNFSSVGYKKIDNAFNSNECKSKCLATPRCLGYAVKYDGKGYCVQMLDELVNGYWSPATEIVTYIKADDSESIKSNFTGMTDVLEATCRVKIRLPIPSKSTTTTKIGIISAIFAAELICGAFFFMAFLMKYGKYREMARTLGLQFLPSGGPKKFSYADLKAATDNFSSQIGRGGFGCVYKGVLQDGRVVAVKCLNKVAGGDAEFWAEVTIIARMHHLNLVRLWGFCAEKGQRILVYEYVPNGSLDKYLFSTDRVQMSGYEEDNVPHNRDRQTPVLDWSIRYRIALGVARSIAYLHEECLEWVLHCDIKPENILLGDDFCPKISDFGLAKLRKKEDMVTMSHARGTPGYMAPEWIRSDPITSKADVYSFGMVLLELVTGVRNFQQPAALTQSENWYFPTWAFDKVFKEMKVEDILDKRISYSYDERTHIEMVDRMVKAAMWCLQERPEIRPSMGKVAKMLEGSIEIIEPQKPTIYYLKDQ